MMQWYLRLAEALSTRKRIIVDFMGTQATFSWKLPERK